MILAVAMVVLGGWVQWLEIAFPAWVFLVSAHILQADIRRRP